MTSMKKTQGHSSHPASGWKRFGLAIGLLVACLAARASIEPAFVIGGHEPTQVESEARSAFALRAVQAGGSDAEQRAALAQIQHLADDGAADALYALGVLHDSGRGLPRDVARSRSYFEKAAARGYAPAFLKLARLSLGGGGAPRDVAAGLAWLEKCAALKQSLCLYEEAALYYVGAQGVAEDPARTLALATRAGELGDRAARWGVAKLYLLGEGTPIDVAKGMGLMRALSDEGYAKATASLGELYADARTRNEFFDGAYNGENVVPDAFTKSVPVDTDKAMSYLQRAASMGYCHANLNLAGFYDQGVAVTRDRSMATDYLAHAVQCSPLNPYYMWRLAVRLQDALGVPRDCASAAKLYSASLSLGHSRSANSLGYMYDKGCDSVPHDDRKALQIYLVGAKAGDSMSQNNVGAMLKHGRGVGSPDMAKGFAWLTLADENGESLAHKNLQNFNYLFSAEDRARGLEHLEVIRKMIGHLDLKPLESGELVY